MNKNQKNQIKLASFSILGLCFVALMVFLNQNQQTASENDLQTKALKRVEIYARRLIDSKFMSEKTIQPETTRRSLASQRFKEEQLDGTVGVDPWGHPFQYFVKKNSDDPNTGKLIVWSKGQDNILQTTNDMINETSKITFSGDDFGTSIDFKL